MCVDDVGEEVIAELDSWLGSRGGRAFLGDDVNSIGLAGPHGGVVGGVDAGAEQVGDEDNIASGANLSPGAAIKVVENDSGRLCGSVCAGLSNELEGVEGSRPESGIVGVRDSSAFDTGRESEMAAGTDVRYGRRVAFLATADDNGFGSPGKEWSWLELRFWFVSG